jgi:hypothetical protein
MRGKIMGVVLLCHLIWVAFVRDDPELACIWTTCDVGFKTMLLPLHLNLVCNNYVELQCMLNFLWICGNMWLVCWIMYNLGLYIGWFEVLHDTQWTTRFIWAQVWQFNCSGGCYCTCALINWTILLYPRSLHLLYGVCQVVSKCEWTCVCLECP